MAERTANPVKFGKDIARSFEEVATQLADIATNVTSFGIKGDGTDSATNIQNAINAISQISKKIIFPYKASFNITGLLTIPNNMEVDFNHSTITTTSSVVLSGSDTTLKNLTLNEKPPIVGSVRGVYCVDGVSHNNIILDNVSTNGFWKGIVVGNETNQNENFVLINCVTTNATSWGCEIVGCVHGMITNHHASYNRLDGLKFGANCGDVFVNGGVFSDNSYNGEYADGIDLYAGGGKIKIIGVTCERNTGCGIHIGSGEYNDPNLYTPTKGTIENLIIDSCRLTANGIGIDLQIIVNDTYTYPGFANINNCIITDTTGNGMVIRARNVSINNCIIRKSLLSGIKLSSSKNVILNNNIVVNSVSQGILVEYSKNISINGGLIDGLSPDYERIGDTLTGTPSHVNGIVVTLDAKTDNVNILYPDIKNYTGNCPIAVNFKSTFPDAKIVYHLHDVGADNLVNYYAAYGSTVIKNNRLYKKNSNTNSAGWELDRIVSSSSSVLTGDGTKTNFTIPHGLSGTPTFFSISPRNVLVANFPYALQADGTNILVYFATALPSGTYSYNWKAEI